MHDLVAIYEKVRDLAKEVLEQYLDKAGNTQFYPNSPKFTDLEVISLAITAECLQIDSENLLWSKIQKDYLHYFPNLCHRTKFNIRRKRLRDYMIQCSHIMAEIMEPTSEYYVVDSMPIPVCKISREKQSTICRKETDEIKANKGYNTSMPGKYFIGYKLHLIVSESGIFQDVMLSGASTHDIDFLKELEETHMINCTLLGDRGYVSAPLQMSLFENHQIKLNIPYRRNQKDYREYPFEMKIKRKRIETCFSQYCDEFRIKYNYAKSHASIESRIYTKIAAMTFKQFYNFRNGRKISQTKHALAA